MTDAPSAQWSAVEQELRESPGTFEFFQAVRLFSLIFAGREPVGHFVPPEREVVRFAANTSLSFPPSQIHTIDWSGPIPKMAVNFMGLTGPIGALPYAYSELIVGRLRSRDRALAEFLDIFNHRMISLFYQAWEKYRFQVAYEREGKDRLSRYLMSLIGLGTPGLQARQEVRDEALLFYSGLLALQPRSAVGLCHMLEDYFGVRVEVEQFVGSWQALDPADQSVFEDGDSFSEQLAVGLVAGDAVWDQQSRVRVRIGPLTQEQYLGFLPSGRAHESVRSLIRFFCGPNLEVELQLILRRDSVPSCDLGNDSASGPRLGWFTWMKSGTEFDRAPEDTVLLIR
ncbi:MAG TPA: type VI secretion system baseplate subunit TssG [Bryobacteraceae bacterium]|nr:type VI secretion system baseplate subunit TssG [Bryobacteraceae bacterium]